MNAVRLGECTRRADTAGVPRSAAIRSPSSTHVPRIGFQTSHPTRTGVPSAAAMRSAAMRASMPGPRAIADTNKAATTASPMAIRRRRTAPV